ncbi:xylulokinase [Muriicola sp. E247]|uniref:xylulokinase n=1 Tax=Muriicola sp. E247 TaxID=3242730 RepID=UPI00352501F7
MYYLGYDIGSSSIKVALIEAESGKTIDIHKEPAMEMPIESPRKGWAEQDPDLWWNYVCIGTQKLLKKCAVDKKEITGIGIAYQMHGLVLTDKEGNPLRNAIIWCDSRAVDIGEQAAADLEGEFCTSHLLNTPGNFTASKLKWVKENEPDIYSQINYFMLPGDYIAGKFTNVTSTTISGLTEGIFWDFKEEKLSAHLLHYYGIQKEIFPPIVPTFGMQGTVSAQAARETGLTEGIPLLYRAGDQPNNALSLNVFSPGEIAMTGGTSAVAYTISDQLRTKEIHRINTFAHVNYSPDRPSLGKLLCINGAGIQYRWLKEHLKVDSYDEMNDLANEINPGSDGLLIYPFGNGAERILFNKNPGASILHLDLNRHSTAHLCRATLEGIAFSLMYGIDILISEGLKPKVIRAGNDNLFKSVVFAQTMCNLIGHPIEIYNTTGAVGAARACMIHQYGFKAFSKIVMSNDLVHTCTPEKENKPISQAYQLWKEKLDSQINQ